MEPVTFYPKISSKIGLLTICILFVALGVWIGTRGEWFGYLCAGFFGLGLPIFAIQMIPGSTYLRLDANGFTYCSLYRKNFTTWRDIKLFYPVTIRQNGMKVREMVGCDYIDGYDKARTARAFSRAVGMSEGALPDTYGKKAEDLAALMNEYLSAWRDAPLPEGKDVSPVGTTE